MTARQEILLRLDGSTAWVAVHEFRIIGHSENALATEVSIMARKGLASGRYRTGERYKEWGLTEAGQAAATVLRETHERKMEKGE